jgi:hypothetical protein
VLRELVQERPDGLRREEVQMRRVVLRLSPEQEAESVLQPKAVRNRPDEPPAGTKYAPDVAEKRRRVADVLEELAGDDHVEIGGVERELLLDVCPAGRDAAARCLHEGAPVDVEPDHLVAGEVGHGERARAAAEIEDPFAGAADVLPEERRSLLTSIDEVEAALALVLVVALTEPLERRRRLGRPNRGVAVGGNRLQRSIRPLAAVPVNSG